MLENDDAFLNGLSLIEMLEYLVDIILICVLELEYELNPESKIILPKETEKEMKKNIILAGRQLHIAYLLCIDDINDVNLLDEENLDRNRFSFLEEKELIDGLRYVAVAIIKVQTQIHGISKETVRRLRTRLHIAYKYIENINILFNK